MPPPPPSFGAGTNTNAARIVGRGAGGGQLGALPSPPPTHLLRLNCQATWCAATAAAALPPRGKFSCRGVTAPP